MYLPVTNHKEDAEAHIFIGELNIDITLKSGLFLCKS